MLKLTAPLSAVKWQYFTFSLIKRQGNRQRIRLSCITLSLPVAIKKGRAINTPQITGRLNGLIIHYAREKVVKRGP